MTVKQLKAQLESVPDHHFVFIEKSNDEFRYSLLESAKIRDVPFKEDPSGKTLAVDSCFVLSDED